MSICTLKFLLYFNATLFRNMCDCSILIAIKITTNYYFAWISWPLKAEHCAIAKNNKTILEQSKTWLWIANVCRTKQLWNCTQDEQIFPILSIRKWIYPRYIDGILTTEYRISAIIVVVFFHLHILIFVMQLTNLFHLFLFFFLQMINKFKEILLEWIHLEQPAT